MLLVIDSNEFIFAFGTSKEQSAKTLIDLLLEKTAKHSFRIPRSIFEEVKRNLFPKAFQEFAKLMSDLSVIDEDIFVPFELVLR